MPRKLVNTVHKLVGLPTTMIVGSVANINTDGTVDVSIRGTTVTELSRLNSYNAPQIGDNVDILAYGSTMLVLGTNGIASNVFAPDRQSGVDLISFVAQTSLVDNITFAIPFDVTPNVFVNIASGSGTTTGWDVRAISVGTNGFQIFVFGPVQTWASIPVQWTAVRV